MTDRPARSSDGVHSTLMWWMSMLTMLVMGSAAAAWSIKREFDVRRSEAASRLEVISASRASQAETWFARQMALAHFLDDSVLFAELFRKWKAEGNSEAGDALLQRVVELRKSTEASFALLVGNDGQLLAQEYASPDAAVEPELRETIALAARVGEAVHSTIYLGGGAAPRPVRMDIVIPLLKTGTPPKIEIILRMSPRASLFPLFQTAQDRSSDAESVLWRRVGDNVVNVSDLARAPASAGTLVQPVGTSSLALPRLLRREMVPRTGTTGVDSQGAEVLWTIVPTAGSDLYLVTQSNLADVDRPATSTAIWIVAGTALMLAFVGVVSRALIQRSALERSLRQQDDQRQRLESLGLLEAIANSSTDSIFALDNAGRYIFCNRAAAAAIGRKPEDVIGAEYYDLYEPKTDAKVTANVHLRRLANVRSWAVTSSGDQPAPDAADLYGDAPCGYHYCGILNRPNAVDAPGAHRIRASSEALLCCGLLAGRTMRLTRSRGCDEPQQRSAHSRTCRLSPGLLQGALPSQAPSFLRKHYDERVMGRSSVCEVLVVDLTPPIPEPVWLNRFALALLRRAKGEWSEARRTAEQVWPSMCVMSPEEAASSYLAMLAPLDSTPGSITRSFAEFATVEFANAPIGSSRKVTADDLRMTASAFDKESSGSFALVRSRATRSTERSESASSSDAHSSLH